MRGKTAITLFIYGMAVSASIRCAIAQQSDNPMRSPLDSTVDKLVKIYMKNSNRVGLSIGIGYKGRTFMYNYGETSPGSGVLPTPHSIYEIGSVTKTFTGLLVAQAITEGKLSLNDDIRKYLPGSFPNLQYPSGDPVKLGYLLAHTAQLPNSFGDVLSQNITEPVFLDSLHTVKLDSLKGFRYNYSNVGYQLLGLILENVYRLKYADLLSRYITVPLKMSQTGLNSGGTKALTVLKGYGANREEVNSMPVSMPAAGSLGSSVADMLKYLHHQNEEKDPAVRLSHRVIVGDVDQGAHAFQWELGKTWSWDQYIRIDGGTRGFRSYCVIYPLKKIEVVVLSNQKDDSAGLELYKIATGIYNTLKSK
jgi:serine-type D-Ala-D-Ala carboxypeptidase/endopeptidase